MNILLVDGNEKEASDRYKRLGMETQYEVYEKVLKKNSKSDINITTIHPAIHEEYLPLGVNLDDFEAIAWTGSLLNIYDQTKPIIKQIELAKKGGADAVKFQSYKADTLASKYSPSYWDTSKEKTRSQYELFKKHEYF